MTVECRMTWIERTAYPRLPRAVAPKELRESFTPSGDEVVWARAHTQSDRHLLALLVALKCYQRLGYFPSAAAIPAPVIDHVRATLGLDADVTADYDVGRTGTRHRDYVRARVGVVWEPARARAVAETAMREALLGKDNPADVINVALEALAAAGCELPGYSTLDEMAATLRAEVNGGFCHLVAGRLDAAGRARLAALLVAGPASRQSALPALTRPAPRATVSRLKQHVAHLRWLDELGETGTWLQGVPAAKIAHFAGEAAVLDADALAEIGPEKQLTLLACLVHAARMRARDEVVTMFCKRMAAITKKARDKLEELREAHRAESERLLGVLGDVLADVREALGPPCPADDDDDDAAYELATDTACHEGNCHQVPSGQDRNLWARNPRRPLPEAGPKGLERLGTLGGCLERLIEEHALVVGLDVGQRLPAGRHGDSGKPWVTEQEHSSYPTGSGRS